VTLPPGGNLIQANGEHGTLVCYHESPSKKEFGGIMIGCESAGAFKTLKRAQNMPPAAMPRNGQKPDGFLGAYSSGPPNTIGSINARVEIYILKVNSSRYNEGFTPRSR